MTFSFPVVELVDRYTIAIVKHEKTFGANQEELDFYNNQMLRFNIADIQQEINELVDIHRRIWAMEDDFKKRKIDNAPLEEIGRRALDIRDLNNQRVTYRNKIAERVNCAVREIKQ